MPSVNITSDARIRRTGEEGSINSDAVVIGGIQSGGLIYINSDAYITGVRRIVSTAQISGKRYSLKSDMRIEDERSSIICDGNEIEEIINEFGTTVVVRVVSKSFSDEYGDAVENYDDHRLIVMVMSYTASDDEVKEGVFKAGEVLFSFRKEDESYAVPGNRVLYAGVWYEIRSIERQPLVDVLYYLTARVQKI